MDRTQTGTLSQARRAARIRKVVEQTMQARAAGTPADDAAVIAAHPDLMPELARELGMLALVERARAQGLGVPTRSPRALEPMPEDAFDGYSLGPLIHAGGQGVVYEATQKSTGRRAAIKVMREGLFGGDMDAARFEREVRILAQIDHPCVVGILGSGVRAGHFFYAMDFVHGEPIDTALAGRPEGDILPVFEQVCDAVNAAHLRGIIHRDLKPANILVDTEGRPRVLDFGLARIVADRAATIHATAAGQFVGSMPWASPEQAAGEQTRVDTRSDVYSLGVILYQLLTGRFPYAVEGGPRDVLDNILRAEPVRPRSLDRRIGDELEAIVLKCLRKDRELRYQNAGALADDLRRYRARLPVLARPPSVAYQLRTFARRHRALVAGTIAVAAALLLGLIGTTLALLDAAAARRAAITRGDEAEYASYVANIAAADAAIRSLDSATAQARLHGAPAPYRGWEWDYIRARADTSLATIATSAIDAGVSADGSRIAILQADHALELLDAASQRSLWRVAVPPDVRGASDAGVGRFSQDGALLSTAHGPDGLIWDARDGTLVSRLRFENSLWRTIDFAFHPGATWVTVSGRDNWMFTWDYAAHAIVRTFPLDHYYYTADVTPDGRTLAVLGSRGLTLLDPATGHDRRTLTLPPGTFERDGGRLSISADGSTLACTYNDAILVYDLGSGSLRTELRGHTQQHKALALNHDGTRAASSAWDRTVRVWDTQRATQVALLLGHTGEPASVGFMQEGSRLLSAATDGTVRVWDTQPADQGPLAGGPMVRALAYTADGRLLSAAHGKPSLWDRHARQPLDLPIPAGQTIPGADISRNGRLLVATTATDSVGLWEMPGRLLWSVPLPQSAESLAFFSPDASRLAIQTTARRDLWILNTKDGARLSTIEGRHGNYAVAFHPTGSLIATGHPHGGAGLWEPDTGRQVAHLVSTTAPQQHIMAVAFSPDGRLLAAGGGAGTVELWDHAATTLLTTLRGMGPAVWSAAFSPDGSRLATGSQDRTVRVWDTRTWQELLLLRGHTGTVMAVAWSPDGRTLASASHDGEVRTWTAAR